MILGASGARLHHVIFDVDGTLGASYDLDSSCYVDADMEVRGVYVGSECQMIEP